MSSKQQKYQTDVSLIQAPGRELLLKPADLYTLDQAGPEVRGWFDTAHIYFVFERPRTPAKKARTDDDGAVTAGALPSLHLSGR